MRDRDDTLKWLRPGIESQLEAHVKHQTVETNETITGITQCYLLLQILEKLDELGDQLQAIDTGISTIYGEVYAERHGKISE